MGIKEINQKRNEKGVFSVCSEGWYALSKDGVNMITFYTGYFVFSEKHDVIKFYNEEGFSKKINQLLKIRK